MDLDDLGFFAIFIELPWQVWLIIVAILVCIFIWYSSLSLEEKTKMCLEEAKPYKVEAKYDEDMGCLVRLDDSHWQKISKYKKAGIIAE